MSEHDDDAPIPLDDYSMHVFAYAPRDDADDNAAKRTVDIAKAFMQMVGTLRYDDASAAVYLNGIAHHFVDEYLRSGMPLPAQAYLVGEIVRLFAESVATFHKDNSAQIIAELDLHKANGHIPEKAKPVLLTFHTAIGVAVSCAAQRQVIKAIEAGESVPGNDGELKEFLNNGGKLS